MLLSLNWLREFVPFTGTADELGARLTMLGLELEDVLRPYDAIQDIVVGHVLTCVDHPQSDHLHICTVDVGKGEALPIVCGAPNVAAGQKVPVALVGTTMPGGLVIKATKLRGEPSAGMICSERELGLSDEHAGIMVLPDSCVPGVRVVEALELDREVLELGVTPNRADCLSVLGLAREVALAFNLPLTLPTVTLIEEDADWTNDFQIAIPDATLCPLYALRRVDNLTVKPSPMRLRHRLHAVGVRPISNVVDVTNYILMELGQPLHAFDCDRLTGQRIEISAAHEGETIVTLDGQERTLLPGDILIRDAEKAIALGGVMGGLNSEITESSRVTLIESAVFRPQNIRRTARRLALSSEASYRFERGVDQQCTRYALDRAAAMMAALSGGSVRTGVLSREDRPWQAPQCVFRKSRAVSLLGVDLDSAFCRETFDKLGCATDERTQDEWQITTPSWRQDLSREADMIEELARVYGMDILPETLPVIKRPLERFGVSESHYDFLLRIKRMLCGMGLHEAENYSFIGHKDLDWLQLGTDSRVSILNPLSEDQNVLRTELLPGLLNTVRHNVAHGNTALRLFEVANAFNADPSSETTVHENPRLAMVLYGGLREGNWPDTERDADYVDLRGLVEHICRLLHLKNIVCEADNAMDHPYLSPCIRVLCDGEYLGLMGRVKPALADGFHARKAIWTAELDLAIVRRLHDAATVRFAPLAVYPTATRDITVITPHTLSLNTIEATLAAMDVKFLERCSLVDVFEPHDAAERNLTLRLVFRHAERTLKDAEVDKEREKIVTQLLKQLPVRM